jgi:AAA family ATP:ADP antiporter
MISWIVKQIRNQTSHYERVFIVLALLCSYFINLEASITKAVSNSLFIHAYSYEYLPYVWLALVPLNFFVVNLYNKFLPRIGCFYMLLCCTLITCIMSLLAAFFVFRYFWIPFVFYLWKDLYIMLMFQQLWAMLAATLTSVQAKKLYGLFWGLGGIGAVTGSFFPGFLATKIGTEKLLLVTLPFYCVLLVCYYFALKVRDNHIAKSPIIFDQNKTSSFVEGAKLIRRSKTLLFIFLVVIFMQVASTLMDFQLDRKSVV